MKNDRRCISCRRVAAKSEFWRVVRLHPSHAIQLDQGAGRSAYLCRSADCLQAAQKKNRLGRALKAPVPEAIYQALWQRFADIAGSASIEASPGQTALPAANSQQP